jgi:pyridoxine 4-dehydrogenase
MSDAYGPADRSESIATLHAALEAGVTLFDTGDFYGSGHNEMLLAEAFAGIARERYQLSVKFGSLRDPSGAYGPVDGRPASIKNFLAYSLNRLRVDYIDVYRAARLDTTVPVEETMGALAECVQEGWIRYIAMSEVGVDTIRRAHAAHSITDDQLEYSILTPASNKPSSRPAVPWVSCHRVRESYNGACSVVFTQTAHKWVV